MNERPRETGEEAPGADAARAAPRRRVGSSLVTVGNFDGVHRGHQAILERGVDEARKDGISPLVLTFHPHPAEVLGRGTLPVLTPLERKLELLRRVSDELEVVVEPFTLELAELSPERFARELLAERLGARKVVVGNNFRFGRGRTGDAEMLRELGHSLGFESRAAALRSDAGGVISSTRVRECIATGDVSGAAQLLGRPHALSGRVVRGLGQARALGIPSANLSEVLEMLPAPGVYAVAVDALDGGVFSRLGLGVANVGRRPTLEAAGDLRAEVHVLDLDADLYDRVLRVHLIRRLRAELRFSDTPALRARLDQDKLEARDGLRDQKPDPRAGRAWY